MSTTVLPNDNPDSTLSPPKKTDSASVVREHQNEEIRRFRHSPRRIYSMTAHLNEVPRLLRDTTEVKAMNRLEEVRRHRLPHHAQSDKA